MGSSFVDFLNQIVSPVQENEQSDQLQLVCECSRGELMYDSLSSQTYHAERNCNIRGVCAFIAKNKFEAKRSSEQYLKLQQLKKTTSSLKIKNIHSKTSSRTKSLLEFIK